MESSSTPPHEPAVCTPPPNLTNRPKSPPLAFEPSSNDSLAPLTLPPTIAHPLDPEEGISPSGTTAMGHLSPVSDLQAIVDQQAEANRLLHDAFQAERRAWDLERERLYQRVTNLELLLIKKGDHHSPAKSPIVSPSITSPSSRPVTNLARLPSIAENENTPPLSQRRDAAPRKIEIPALPTIVDEPEPRTRQSSVVQFNSGLAPLKVEEIPISPQPSNVSVSPLPINHREMAGHTPLNAPRPPTPPPKGAPEDIEDTPTRNNTHLNNMLTKTNKSDEDIALKGPLNMPELPNQPGAHNFTLDALSKSLEQVARSPDECKPTIFAQPTPGMMTPPEPATEASPAMLERSTQGHIEPTGTRDKSSTNLTSASLSPGNAGPMSPSLDAQTQQDLEHGGIKLKKKLSTNFGAPFGSLGGFAGSRRMS